MATSNIFGTHGLFVIMIVNLNYMITKGLEVCLFAFQVFLIASVLQALGEAYQVLSNPTQRHAYDAYGKSGISS